MTYEYALDLLTFSGIVDPRLGPRPTCFIFTLWVPDYVDPGKTLELNCAGIR